jgi:prepilin-type N-terminal cleavage/methylation domain-containing protein
VSRRPSRVGAGAAGLTLVELTVVVAVLAVVAVFALPAVRRGSESLQLRATAGRVASLLREARQQAVTHRRPTRFALEGQGRAAAFGWEDAEEPLRRVELPARLRVEATGGTERLTFSSRGLARDARWLVEGPSGRQLVVEVHGVTGRVSVAAPGP